MENFLGKLLATVDFSFLEQHRSLEEWNDHLLDLFKWLNESEKDKLKDDFLHVALLNDNQIFYKKTHNERIEIYQNLSQLKPDNDRQLIVIFVNSKERAVDNDLVSNFIQKLIDFLKQKKIQNRILNVRNKSFSDNYSVLNSVFEIVLG